MSTRYVITDTKMSALRNAAERLADAVEAVLYLAEETPGEQRIELEAAWRSYCEAAADLEEERPVLDQRTSDGAWPDFATWDDGALNTWLINAASLIDVRQRQEHYVRTLLHARDAQARMLRQGPGVRE